MTLNSFFNLDFSLFCPVISLSKTDAEDLPTVVQRFGQSSIRHLPVLDSHGQVLSMITQGEVIERLCQTIDTVGLPADFESKKAKTLDMTLLHGLVKQLRGTIQIHNQQGTEFKIIFSKSKAARQ